MSRRRPLSIAAVLAIAVISVFGGPLTANAAPPPAITLVTPVAGDDGTGSVVATGTFATLLPAPTIVRLDSISTETGVGLQVCTVTVPAGETAWTCTGNYQSGAQRIYAAAWEQATPAEIITSNEVLVMNYGQEAVVVGSPALGSEIVDRTPTFSGTGPRYGTINVGDGSGPLCSSPVSAAGT